jgi:sugar lactone lactonase YvrE
MFDRRGFARSFIVQTFPALLLLLLGNAYGSGLPVGCGISPIPTERTVGRLEVAACFNGAMPTGVAVSHDGRIFVNFPRWGDKAPYTVAEVVNGKIVPFPNAEFNEPNTRRAGESLISVQSVVVDPKNRLWLLDTGRLRWAKPVPGGPKLVAVDLTTNKVAKSIRIPPDVALDTTYLNDVRFDLRRGKEGTAFITDSSGEEPGFIVVDLATGKSMRRLSNHPSTRPIKGFITAVEGRPMMFRPPRDRPRHVEVGVDGIAIGRKGERLFYCALSSWKLYSVSVDALINPTLSDEQVAKTVKDLGDKIVASDGLESDAAGNVYLSAYDHNAIIRRTADGALEPVVYDPRALWPDTLCLATDGYLYFTANQLHRQAVFNYGKDLREKPYILFRVKVDARPVLLK